MENEADKAIAFIEGLKNPEGTEWAGEPIRLLEWQKQYIRRLLDTRTAEGHPRYEKSLLFLPKKQGKTTFMAALAVWFLFGRKHQQIICVANTREQASHLFHFAKSMIGQHAWLREPKRCRVYKGNVRRIACHYSDSSLQVLSSDAVNANGLNCSILLYDEVCFAEKGDLWDAIVSGGINRRHILAIGISTAGFSTAGFGYQLYERAKAVAADPALDPSFLPVLYEAPPGADWTKVQTYLDCSPTFRETGAQAIRRIEGMIETAKNDPAELRRIERYHLNRWIGADAATPWIPLTRWDTCATLDGITLDALAGRPCYAGLDLASAFDLTALALLFPLDAGRYAALLRFYMPAEGIADKERRDAAHYAAWARSGHITLTPGDWCDYAYVRADIAALRRQYQVLGIAIDRAYNAAHLSQQLMQDHGEGFVAPIGQGSLTIAPAARELETLVASKRLMHFGNPVLRWNVANCVAKVIDDVGNVKPSKVKSTGRIDGVYALMDALALESSARRGGAGTPGVFFF